jgi:hypothetical protein
MASATQSLFVGSVDSMCNQASCAVTALSAGSQPVQRACTKRRSKAKACQFRHKFTGRLRDKIQRGNVAAVPAALVPPSSRRPGTFVKWDAGRRHGGHEGVSGTVTAGAFGGSCSAVDYCPTAGWAVGARPRSARPGYLLSAKAEPPLPQRGPDQRLAQLQQRPAAAPDVIADADVSCTRPPPARMQIDLLH